jgi:hypothetical protein
VWYRDKLEPIKIAQTSSRLDETSGRKPSEISNPELFPVQLETLQWLFNIDWSGSIAFPE